MRLLISEPFAIYGQNRDGLAQQRYILVDMILQARYRTSLPSARNSDHFVE